MLSLVACSGPSCGRSGDLRRHGVSGVAAFDYNNDGKPDIYFVNGALEPKLETVDASYYNPTFQRPPASPHTPARA